MVLLAFGAVLPELLARLGAAPGRVLALSAEEVRQWPADAVDVLKSHAVLRPGQPGTTAVCPGCEQSCVMPVEQRVRPDRPVGLFIVCDRRDDMGRVPISPAHLERWRVDGQTLGDALAALLGSGACRPVPAEPFAFRVGMVVGQADKAAVLLRLDGAAGPRLVVAGHVVDLTGVLTIQHGKLVLDVRHLARCADVPAGGAALVAETAAQRGARLVARKAVLQRQGVKAFLQALADEEGVSVSMVKRILGRANTAGDAPLPGWAAPVAPRRGVSATGKPRR